MSGAKIYTVPKLTEIKLGKKEEHESNLIKKIKIRRLYLDIHLMIPHLYRFLCPCSEPIGSIELLRMCSSFFPFDNNKPSINFQDDSSAC